jgi:formylglycine-generating enzyme required for sulfatase activity
MKNLIEMLQRTALMVMTILLALAILLGACASEPPVEEPAEEEPEEEPTAIPEDDILLEDFDPDDTVPATYLQGELGIEPVLKDDAKVLSEDAVEEIIEYDPEAGELILPADAEGADEIEEGDIIVGGISDETPDGILLKVESIEEETESAWPGNGVGGRLAKPASAAPSSPFTKLIIRTVSAQLTDLFKSAEIMDDVRLGGSDIDQSDTGMNGIQLDGGEIKVQINKDIECEESGEKATLSGSVKVNPQLDFHIVIEEGELQQIRVSNRTTYKTDVSLSVKKEFRQGKRVLLKEIKFKRKKLLIPVPGSLPIPVIYRPILSVYVGADGSISSEMSVSAKHEVTYQRGLVYDGQAWGKIYNMDAKGWDFEASSSVSFNARAYLSPRLDIKFYGMAGPYVEASVYLRFEINPNEEPDWKLACGMDASVGIEFKVLGVGNLSYSYQKRLIQVPEWVIAPSEEKDAPPSIPPPGATRTREIDGATMVYVPAGEFQMGSTEDDPDAYDDEFPQHQVYIDAFWIDKYEVTNTQFATFLNEQGNQKQNGVDWLGSASLIEEMNNKFQPKNGYANHPVIGISWEGAKSYAEWVGGRLPTEAEWEYAARGPNENIYPWGNIFDNTRLNFCDVSCSNDYGAAEYDDGFEHTAPVGTFPNGASWCGALDMAGNVWEWVEDSYDEEFYSTYPTDKSKNSTSGTNRVARGGSYLNFQQNVRCTTRFSGFVYIGTLPVSVQWISGFRIVMDD